MTVGSPINKDYANRELVVCDSYGRVLMFDSRGVYGDGMYSASGAFDGGYPASESSDYKTGTIDANITGTTTSASANKLVDSGASFGAWLVGCKVEDSASNTAIITAVDDANTLSIDTDIFSSGEAYTIHMTAAVTVGASTYTYIVDSSAAWLEGVNAGTNYNYIGLRGLWCQFVNTNTGVIQQKRIAGNETNKLWFSGTFGTTLTAGETYYVAGIYFEYETGYIYGSGERISLKAFKSRVASTNGTSFYVECTGSGRDQSVNSASDFSSAVGAWIRDEPTVNFRSVPGKWQKVVIKGVIQGDQLVFRSAALVFDEHER